MSSIDPAEVGKFAAMAQDWWNPDGKFAPLHRMNPLRLEWIAGQVAAQFGRDRRAPSPFAGLALLDIGCGGGLVAEPMARLGARVTGADATEVNIAIASAHADEAGLAIDYRATTAEALAAEGARFDAVLALEIVEHVADPAAFIDTCGALLRPGGLLVATTLNRTAESFAKAILGAEWLLRWLPRGTHDWSRFLTPAELEAHLRAAGLTPVARTGMAYDPLRRSWSLSPRMGVNYAMAAVRPA